MKKIITIFLILLLSLNTAGMLLYYLSQLEIHKTAVKASIVASTKLNTHLITAFSSRNKNFTLENENELQYNGNMYDVVKTIVQAGDTMYYAITDKEEDAMIVRVAFFSGSNAATNQVPEMKSTFEILKFVNSNNFGIMPHRQYVASPLPVRVTKELSFYQSPLLSVPFPPPRLTVSAI